MLRARGESALGARGNWRCGFAFQRADRWSAQSIASAVPGYPQPNRISRGCQVASAVSGSRPHGFRTPASRQRSIERTPWFARSGDRVLFATSSHTSARDHSSKNYLRNQERTRLGVWGRRLIPSGSSNTGDRSLPLGSLAPVHTVVVMAPAVVTSHRGVSVVPAGAPIASAGVRIARSLVLAIGVRIELRAVAGVIDDLLRRSRGRKPSRQQRRCRQQVFHDLSPLL